MTTGLFYADPKTGRENNYKTLLKKFLRNIDTVKARFGYTDYSAVYMLRTPIVEKSAEEDISSLQDSLREKGIELHVIYNEKFMEAIRQLRAKELRDTKALASPVMRLFQIEEKLKKYLQTQTARKV